MKKYYVMADCDVMEIGKPVSEWVYRKNTILPNETEPGCWEIISEDYYFDEKGNRKDKVRVIHTRKNKVLEGNFETLEEAMRDLDEFYKTLA